MSRMPGIFSWRSSSDSKISAIVSCAVRGGNRINTTCLNWDMLHDLEYELESIAVDPNYCFRSGRFDRGMRLYRVSVIPSRQTSNNAQWRKRHSPRHPWAIPLI